VGRGNCRSRNVRRPVSCWIEGVFKGVDGVLLHVREDVPVGVEVMALEACPSMVLRERRCARRIQIASRAPRILTPTWALLDGIQRIHARSRGRFSDKEEVPGTRPGLLFVSRSRRGIRGPRASVHSLDRGLFVREARMRSAFTSTNAPATNGRAGSGRASSKPAIMVTSVAEQTHSSIPEVQETARSGEQEAGGGRAESQDAWP
jgi:hypothetical protein